MKKGSASFITMSILGVIIVAAAGFFAWHSYVASHSSTTPQANYTNGSGQPSAQAAPASASTSDQDLQNDLNNVDAKLNTVNTDLKETDNSQNDSSTYNGE